MLIRKTLPEDLPLLDTIFDECRAYMTQEGNPTQWDENYPTSAVVAEDIKQGHGYVCLNDAGEVVASFALGDSEPEYERMREGSWHSDAPYIVVHRMGALPHQGAGQFIFAWLMARYPHIRIDTHAANKTMRHILEKLGFKRTGVVTYEGYGDRICFDYVAPARKHAPARLNFRKATAADLDRLDELFEGARQFMYAHNNFNQWMNGFPNQNDVKPALEAQELYVVVDEEHGDEIVGTFVLSDYEPVYDELQDGQWQSDQPYKVIHRMATVQGRGVGTFIFKLLMAQYPYLRIDTHQDNKPMHELATKLGFKRVGKVFYNSRNAGWRECYDYLRPSTK